MMHSDIVTEAFMSRLRAFVRHRVQSDADADDITQSTLLKLVRDHDSITKGSGPAWIFMVARREIVDHYRRRLHGGSQDASTEPESPERGEASVITELAHCVEPLLDSLSELDRDILRRVDLLGESQADIADSLGVPRSTVKARTQRARQRFHDALLSCCTIELDARGMPLAFGVNPTGRCGCGTTSLTGASDTSCEGHS